MVPPSKKFPNKKSKVKHALNKFEKPFKPKSKSGAVKPQAAALQLEDDLPDFPRGGGSSLSGEELDEVRAEVDAVFEADARELKKKKKKRLQKRSNSAEDGLGSLFGGGISCKLPRFANKITWKHVKTGDIFDDSKVISVDRGLGLLLEIPTSPFPTPAYVSVSGVADEEVKKLEKNFKEGRVIGTQSTMLPESGPSGIQYLDIECENREHPVLADVETRASIRPLQVHLDDIEIPRMDDTVCQNKELVDSADTIDAKKKSRAKKKAREEREQEIRAAEERLLEKDMPRNADEFEKMVRSSPNSSFVWIKYMAFMLSLADVENARSIAERALKTINIREESEKLNIWVAYFNLENKYGNPPEEAVLKIFQRALQYCDPKKVHMALLGMYERTEQHKLADELLNKMIRKFKHSCKVWLRRIQWLLKQNRDEVQPVVKRAVLCLPRHKHIKFLSQAAILEFKCGVPDRGRSMFEGILREYPKRTDLWSIYLDQEIRLGDVDVICALFERAISLSLPPKKMKFLFKKYLEYEKSLGDEERIESVKRKAMEYVEYSYLMDTSFPDEIPI